MISVPLSGAPKKYTTDEKSRPRTQKYSDGVGIEFSVDGVLRRHY